MCSNGFIAFDLSNSTTPYPSNIPSPAAPNAIIAALWTDLCIDDDASIITGLYYDKFIITWKNASHKESVERLTFQIVLDYAPQFDLEVDSQSYIFINYKKGNSISTPFAYGIEDQEGFKGCGSLLNGGDLASLNQKTIAFYHNSSNFFIEHLILEFEDTNPDTKYNILQPPDFPNGTRGYHVRTKTEPWPEPDPTLMFGKALAGTGVLLITAAVVLLKTSFFPYTFPVSCILVGLIWVEYLAYAQYSSIEWLELRDSFTDPPMDGAYIKVPVSENYIADASLSVVFHWILDTPNDVGTHSLTITAKLEYYEYNRVPWGTQKNLTTSLNIKIGPDDNENFGTADPIQPRTYSLLWLGGYDQDDYYKIHLNQGEVISVSMTPLSEADYDLFLYDPRQGPP